MIDVARGPQLSTIPAASNKTEESKKNTPTSSIDIFLQQTQTNMKETHTKTKRLSMPINNTQDSIHDCQRHQYHHASTMGTMNQLTRSHKLRFARDKAPCHDACNTRNANPLMPSCPCQDFCHIWKRPHPERAGHTYPAPLRGLRWLINLELLHCIIGECYTDTLCTCIDRGIQMKPKKQPA